MFQMVSIMWRVCRKNLESVSAAIALALTIVGCTTICLLGKLSLESCVPDKVKWPVALIVSLFALVSGVLTLIFPYNKEKDILSKVIDLIFALVFFVIWGYLFFDRLPEFFQYSLFF